MHGERAVLEFPDGAAAWRGDMTAKAATRHGPRPEEPLPGIIPPRREYRCPVCGAQFVSQQQLDEHERSEHTP